MTYRPRRLRPYRPITLISGVHEDEIDVASAAIRAARASGGMLFVPGSVSVVTIPGPARWYLSKDMIDIRQWGVGTPARTLKEES